MSAAANDDWAISVRACSSLDDVGAANWTELWQRAVAPSVFSSYDWVAAWWSCFSGGRTLRIYLAYRAGRLVGILPVVMRAGRAPGFTEAVILGDPHADYAAILTARGHDDAFPALVSAACHDLAPRGQLMLRRVREDLDVVRYLQAEARRPLSRWRLVEVVSCPRTILTQERLAGILNKTSIKRQSRKLARLGSVTADHFHHERDIAPRLEAFFEQHVARWAHTDSPSLFVRDPNRDFFRELARRLSGTGRLVFSEVCVNGVPAASHFGFVSEDDFIWYKPTFDPALADASPGKSLIRELLLWAGQRQLSGFDFTHGDEAFKSQFADHKRAAFTFSFHTSRGTAVLERASQRLRRLARSVVPRAVAAVLNRRRPAA